MAIATGVAKVLAYKKETTWGVLAGAASGKQTRRVTSDLTLKKQTYESNEIRNDYQVGDFRHGVRSVEGMIDGELSVGTYQDFMATVLRRLFTSVTALTALSLTIAASGSLWTITRGSGTFLTTGLKVGVGFRLTAGTFNASNLNKTLIPLAITATVVTVMVLNGSALVAEGPIAAATMTIPGRVTYAPLTGHIDESYTIEHWHADVAQSEVFTGCKVQSMDIGLPATGMGTCKTTFLGKDVTTGVAQYFTTPTAAGVTGILAAVNGAVAVNGALVALITGCQMTIAANQSAEAVVGSNSYPDIQEGRIKVNGSMTVMFQDAIMRDAFFNETESSVMMAFSASNAAGADFITFVLPRVKFGSADKDDGEKALIQTMSFVGLLATTGGSGFENEQTTMLIHDSVAV